MLPLLQLPLMMMFIPSSPPPMLLTFAPPSALGMETLVSPIFPLDPFSRQQADDGPLHRNTLIWMLPPSDSRGSLLLVGREGSTGAFSVTRKASKMCIWIAKAVKMTIQQ